MGLSAKTPLNERYFSQPDLAAEEGGAGGEGGWDTYVGTEKIVGRGGPKIMTGWGVKIWLQGRGQLHGTGRG